MIEYLICLFFTVLLQDPVFQSVFWKFANNTSWAKKLNRLVRSIILYKHKQQVCMVFSFTWYMSFNASIS